MNQPQSPIYAAIEKALGTTNPFYHVLIDLEAFNQRFVVGVPERIKRPQKRERCFLITYYRSVLNINSIIVLNNAVHFQAIAMLARNLFELAVEIRLIDLIPNGVHKMVVFEQLERLRAALRATAFASTHTLKVPVDLSPFHRFIKTKQSGIEADAKKLWGSLKLTHWSERTLAVRAKMLGVPFEETYQFLYKQLSWHAHAGLAGVLNVPPETCATLSIVSCKIAAESYQEILMAVVKEFKLSKATPTIENEFTFARLRAHTKDAQQEAALRQTLDLS